MKDKNQKMMDPGLPRRRFLLSAIFMSIAAMLVKPLRAMGLLPSSKPEFSFIRPPGTLDEEMFNLKCIRCRACANVCEAGCIQFFSFTDSLSHAGTPYLIPREKSCNLCMNCTQVCPTGALEPITRELKIIAKKVDMGKAEVLESHCISFHGRICGICRDACPLKGEAIRLKPRARPVVIEEHCIGCGRCEERCPQFPAAIIVRRKETRIA